MRGPTMPTIDRFLRHVEKTDGCWTWTASTSGPGYGQFSVEGKLRQAHRVSWELLVGPIPDGLTLDHLCRNKLCVKPSHLEPVTIRENILRSTSPSAENARKTYCLRGHELPARPARTGRADRVCRQCQTLRRRKSGVPPRMRPSNCPQGHAYTPENTKEGRSGMQCRECARQSERRRQAARRADAYLAEQAEGEQ